MDEPQAVPENEPIVKKTMGMNRITWILLIVLSIVLFIFIKNEQDDIAYSFGMVLGTYIYPFLIVLLVRFFYFLFKKIMPDNVKRNTFIIAWLFFSFVLINIQRKRDQYVGKEELIKQCMKTARDSAKYDIEKKMNLEKYCDCAVSKLLKQPKMDSLKLAGLRNVNSVLFNEIIMTCVESSSMERKSGNILGITEMDTVMVLNTPHGVKVKVRIGDEYYYFMIDSGASDSFITSSLEKKLREANVLNDSSYISNQSYQMANGDIIDCKRAVINGVQVGEFLVDSVTVAIYDKEVEFLLGKSFLESFSSWSLIEKNNKLVLKK